MGRIEICNTVLVSKPEEKDVLENNIMMNLRKIRWDGMDWIHLV
jgi:hypothetical protein